VTTLDDLFEEVEDLLVAGGCDVCAAWTTSELTESGGRRERVFHAPGCPVLTAMRMGDQR